ncbi:RluA family pseudouridine synthase [Clostridium intestinale]|uniref:Pseudouridine synthase n=1 Tax=Clostridium intestinale DSM 6191 TaxID=1121320 RepID=A0A1M5Z096_9CLOT|nr:RluA family pseudouridine synthase [Clostridium intestinale]SHI17641.1 23S rRNA pseudouridine1911/1915/1917 synthase [Clostridium intestinale DSM 6191]
MEELIFKITSEEVNKRIDKYLSEVIENKSRSFIQGLIDNDNIKVNDKLIKSNYKLKLNDIIEVNLPEPLELEVKAEDIKLDIVYEDHDVIVVNKPQGMVVHPAPGNYTGTLVNALLYHCKDLSGINGVIRPGIVHRIDKDTSGILVVAKNDNSHNFLAAQLKDHSMKREYYALVEGRVKNDIGTINEKLGRDPKDRIKMAIVKEGREAITHYEVLENYDYTTLVKCNLETGRTHQIRVHMAHIGHPLVGDPVYSYKKSKFKLMGQMLHAKTLGFVHPTTKEFLEFSTELPSYFKNIIEKLRG